MHYLLDANLLAAIFSGAGPGRVPPESASKGMGELGGPNAWQGKEWT
ncbi:MAG: hypothetical protein QOH47_2446 [Sphingomonadales bacterium]|jgi:hypothetical protein|nr:hypothetical protein [Sphingomonadales bacterium]